MAPFHQLYSGEHPSQPEGFYLIDPKHRNSRKWWKCTNEWNGGTYLRARWAFVLKRERRWKNVPRLGSGSELCVAAPSVSLWLCTARCNNCICLWIGYETNLPGKAALTRSSTPTLWVYCNMQTAIRIKTHTLARTHMLSLGHNMLLHRANEASRHIRLWDSEQASRGRRFLLAWSVFPL